jgi:hypothetical protein
MNTRNAHRFNSSGPDRQSEKSSAPTPAPSLKADLAAFRRSGSRPPSLRTLGARGTSSRAFSYSVFL